MDVWSPASVWLVLPIRSLAGGKRRLAPALSAGERAALIVRWFRHLLAVASTLPELADIVVVSRDPQVRRMARAAGAQAIPDPAPFTPEHTQTSLDVSLNRAVVAGIRRAAAAGAQAVLVLPGDLPHVTPQEIQAILAAGQGSPRVVLVPSRDGGTNALYLSPPGLLEPAFGPQSFQRHLAQAQRHGVPVTVWQSPGLARDVDHPGDLEGGPIPN